MNSKSRRRWQWPRFSLREVMVVIAGFAVLTAYLGRDAEDGEGMPLTMAVVVLLAMLAIWKFVRANQKPSE